MRLQPTVVGDMGADLKRFWRSVESASTRAIGVAGRRLKVRLVNHIQGRFTRAKWAKAWSVRVYPKGTTSANASAVVRSRVPELVYAFDKPVTINGEKWLAIPTVDAPRARGRGRPRATPAKWAERFESRYGKLKMIPLPGNRTALLYVNAVRRRRGKRGGIQGAREFSKRTWRTRDYETNVVMFVLVRQTRMPKRIDIRRVEREFAAIWPTLHANTVGQMLR